VTLLHLGSIRLHCISSFASENYSALEKFPLAVASSGKSQFGTCAPERAATRAFQNLFGASKLTLAATCARGRTRVIWRGQISASARGSGAATDDWHHRISGADVRSDQDKTRLPGCAPRSRICYHVLAKPEVCRLMVFSDMRVSTGAKGGTSTNTLHRVSPDLALQCQMVHQLEAAPPNSCVRAQNASPDCIGWAVASAESQMRTSAFIHDHTEDCVAVAGAGGRRRRAECVMSERCKNSLVSVDAYPDCAVRGVVPPYGRRSGAHRSWWFWRGANETLRPARRSWRPGLAFALHGLRFCVRWQVLLSARLLRLLHRRNLLVLQLAEPDTAVKTTLGDAAGAKSITRLAARPAAIRACRTQRDDRPSPAHLGLGGSGAGGVARALPGKPVLGKIASGDAPCWGGTPCNLLFVAAESCGRLGSILVTKTGAAPCG
jgi:hypothetical protein